MLPKFVDDKEESQQTHEATERPRALLNNKIKTRISEGKIWRVFQNRDFRLMWLGALFSFSGSQIQIVAQGLLVYELTGKDAAKLALIALCQSLPVAVFAPFAGSFADIFDKKRVLIIAQTTFAACAIFMALATWQTFGLSGDTKFGGPVQDHLPFPFPHIQYWHVVVLALIMGFFGCIEMPTRQSIVGKVVPPKDLSAAIPINAMTFNIARFVGPVIAGFLLAAVGYAACYGLNGISFLALILAVLAIRTNLSAERREPQPMKDLLLEGMLYTFRHQHLKLLFFLETATAALCMFYIPLMPAIADEMLGLDEKGLGLLYGSVGVGALTGLFLNTHFSETHHKARIVRYAMTTLALAVSTLSFVRNPIFAYPLLAIIGMCVIMQFNTTNTLFQTLSPTRIRGRVLAMHVWALAGISPFGAMFFGELAQRTKEANFNPGVAFIQPGGVQLALQISGVLMALAAGYAWRTRSKLDSLTEADES